MSQTLVAYFSASGVTPMRQRFLQRQQGLIFMRLNRKFLIQEPI